MKNLIILVFTLVFTFENADSDKRYSEPIQAQKQFVGSGTFFKIIISEENTISEESDAKKVECDSVVKNQNQFGRNEKLFGLITFINVVIPALHPLHYDLPPPEFIFSA